MAEGTFNEHLLRYFDAYDGAWSPVTAKDEVVHRQITLSKDERRVLFRFHENLHRGPKKDDPVGACREFLVHNSGRRASVSVIHPKPERNETRLYMTREFDVPRVNAVWFIYASHDHAVPCIGWMPQALFARIEEGHPVLLMPPIPGCVTDAAALWLSNGRLID